MDTQSAGGVVNAGLFASILQRRAGRAGTSSPTHCSDCGAAVAGGRFCAACGQPTHVHRTLLHLLEEVGRGILHFDTRIWRTLPLLAFRPGRLTREWVQGRRTRYVSPLALYLFTMFLLFFVLQTVPVFDPPRPLAERQIEARAKVADARATLAAARAELAAAAADTDAASEASATVEEADEALTDAVEDDAALTKAAATTRGDGLEPGSWQALVRDQALAGKLNINLTGGDFDRRLERKFLNPDLAVYKLQQATSTFSFLLVPLSLPFVALLFLWRPGFTLYDHGVFVLYSLTFVALLTIVVAGLARLPVAAAASLTGLLTMAIPVHQFFQLKGAYGLSWFSALWRTLMLQVFCWVVISLFVASVIALGLSS